MDYPEWVDMPRGQSLRELRRKRLTFIMRRIALELDESGSYRIIAERTSMKHSTLCGMISRGEISKELAEQVEQLVGAELAPVRLLLDPLNGDKPRTTDNEEL